MAIRLQKSQGRLRRGHNLVPRMPTTFTTYHVDRVLHMVEEVEEEDILRGARNCLESI